MLKPVHYAGDKPSRLSQRVSAYPLAEYKCVSCGAAGPRQGGTYGSSASNARSAFDEWAGSTGNEGITGIGRKREMLEVLVGAILATALLYIGRCWGKQEQTISIKTEPIGTGRVRAGRVRTGRFQPHETKRTGDED